MEGGRMQEIRNRERWKEWKDRNQGKMERREKKGKRGVFTGRQSNRRSNGFDMCLIMPIE